MESIKKLYKIGYGPSSSHTMGPQKAIESFLLKYQTSVRLHIILYGSLALTGKGHLTDFIIKKTAEPLDVTFDWQPAILIEDHPNTMDIIGYDHNENIIAKERVYSIGGGDILVQGEKVSHQQDVYPHHYFTEIKNYCYNKQLSLIDYINHYDPNIDDYLIEVWEAMLASIDRGIQTHGLLKGDLHIIRKAPLLFHNEQEEIKLAAYAYAVNEENASASGLVVTAPTCGASGTLPAVLKYIQETEHYSDNLIIDALKVAGLIGTIVKTNASISGAVAGCQAEVGTATSMAAAALAFLRGHSIETIESAAEIAMEHQLGLTCDPVNGYVQIPCIQRNAVAAQKAITACQLASVLQGDETIAFDTVVHTMYETGKDLPYAYRETSKGGLAIHYRKK